MAFREKRPNGRSFIVTGNLALVAPDGLTLTTEIADAVGIGIDTGTAGLLFEYGAYTGFTRGDPWEWLSKVERA